MSGHFAAAEPIHFPTLTHRAIDNMKGVATLGGGGAPRKTPLWGTSFYTPTSVDQVLWEQALHGRVTELSQSFANWLPGKLGL